MTTAKDVETEILERAGLTREAVKDLPMVAKVMDGAGRLWEWNKPSPSNPSMTVHSMFYTEPDDGFLPGDVRIYAFPTSTTEPLPFARYIVNRSHAGFGGESMSDEVFMDEIVSEVQAMALERGILEECPNEECEELVLSTAEKCPECGTPLVEDEGTPAEGATAETLPAPPEPTTM
jgi:hypothetical protein